jgi:hypothetical protein
MLREIEILLECQIITFLYQVFYQIARLEVHSASVYSLAEYVRAFECAGHLTSISVRFV